MKEIAISKFKATCPAVLDKVRRTRRLVRVTRFGKPVAEIVPFKAKAKRKKAKSWLGYMKGTAEIVGDIVSPLGIDGISERRMKLFGEPLE